MHVCWHGFSKSSIGSPTPRDAARSCAASDGNSHQCDQQPALSSDFNAHLGKMEAQWHASQTTSGTYAGAGTRLGTLFAKAGLLTIGEQVYHLDWSWGALVYQQIIRDIVVTGERRRACLSSFICVTRSRNRPISVLAGITFPKRVSWKIRYDLAI
jgi:hypothetical protein